MKERKCDECEKDVRHIWGKDSILFFDVEFKTSSKLFTSEKYNLDFCSVECLLKYIADKFR